MPVTNLNNDHFTDKEMNTMNSAWDQILGVLTGKSRNLSPEERQKYGSISEQNKLVVIKALDFNANQPHLNCPDVDYKELAADWADRTFISGFLGKLDEAQVILNNIRITHDYDVYTAVKVDYDFTKYKLGTDPGAGWESKYNEYLQFFKTNDGSTGAGNTEKNNEQTGQ